MILIKSLSERGKSQRISLLIFIYLSTICFLTFSVVNLTFAKEKKSQKKIEPLINIQNTQQLLKDPAPFEIGVQKLPPSYKGQDIEVFILNMSRKYRAKEEFETTEDYNKRTGAFTPMNPYAFSIEKAADRLHSNYNADTRTFRIYIPIERINNINKKNPLNYTWNEATIITKIVSKDSSYQATNIQGAVRQVRSYYGTMYGIALDVKPDSNMYVISLNMTPDKAKELQKKYDVLLVCNLVTSGSPSSYWFRSGKGKSPTFDDPTEISYTQIFYYVRLLEIWVYDSVTGEILVKEKISREEEK